VLRVRADCRQGRGGKLDADAVSDGQGMGRSRFGVQFHTSRRNSDQVPGSAGSDAGHHRWSAGAVVRDEDDAFLADDQRGVPVRPLPVNGSAWVPRTE